MQIYSFILNLAKESKNKIPTKTTIEQIVIFFKIFIKEFKHSVHDHTIYKVKCLRFYPKFKINLKYLMKNNLFCIKVEMGFININHYFFLYFLIL